MMSKKAKLNILNYHQDDEIQKEAEREQKPKLKIYIPAETCVVLGRGSDPERELNIENCLKDKMVLRRRKGGGCAVVIDPGNVILSIALPVPGIRDSMKHFESISSMLIKAFDRIGFPNVYREDKSDLAIDDRKIAGACIYRKKGLLSYSTSILVDPDVELMERYLKHPPREPDYRRKRSHREFVGALKNFCRFTDIQSVMYDLETELKRSISGLS